MNNQPLPASSSTVPSADADLVTYATLLARFAHRFADRAGILDARGLAEGEFAALETAVLGRLQAAATTGNVGTLNAFAWAIVCGRAALDEGLPTSEPTTRATSTRRASDEAEPITAAAPPIAPASSEPAPLDPSELMATLHSEASRRR